ncbi:casein kinase II regulatory subunit [Nitzschia inconspicua]|uniref:Casein kinase II subunit beta n=1 Tax=Nitzschia inconspicua TaxID=303405 RepID=A0A9K3L4J8_9STRA|nr:casein kinase II regulatory subunit [Nitzschia inconspicua]
MPTIGGGNPEDDRRGASPVNSNNDSASFGRPSVSSHSINNGDVTSGDMLARLSLNEDNERGGGGGAILRSNISNDEIGPSDSLEVQLPNPRQVDMSEGVAAMVSPSRRQHPNQHHRPNNHQSSSSFGPPGRSHSGAGRKRSSKDAAQEASASLQSLQANAPPPANSLSGVGGGDRIIRSSAAVAASNGPTIPLRTTDALPALTRASGNNGPPEEEEYVEEEDEESSEVSASDEDGSWITWFCSLRGNEFFCEVDEDYIQDDFNLTGLNLLVPYYEYALDMVLDVEMPMEDSLTEEQQEIVESAAEMLYGLIHARYIVTNRGMHSMYEKYRTAAFGRCPRVFCQGQPVLPVGLSDLPRNYTVNVFCPRCHGLFFPKSTRQANIDGAYFGTTFPHLYLMTHPDMIPPKPAQTYIPRVYGFKVHESSLFYTNHEDGPQSQLAVDGAPRQTRRSRDRNRKK